MDTVLYIYNIIAYHPRYHLITYEKLIEYQSFGFFSMYIYWYSMKVWFTYVHSTYMWMVEGGGVVEKGTMYP